MLIQPRKSFAWRIQIFALQDCNVNQAVPWRCARRWEDIVDELTAEDEEEEASAELEEQEDIFELEGVSRLDRLDLEAGAAVMHKGGDMVGWEGGKKAAAASAAAATAAAAAAAAANAPSGAAAAEASTSGRQPVEVAVNKLDSLMEVLFQHISNRCRAGQLPAVWDTVLGMFERTLLHAHRSKFTQFLLFYVAYQDPDR